LFSITADHAKRRVALRVKADGLLPSCDRILLLAGRTQFAGSLFAVRVVAFADVAANITRSV